MPLDYKQSIAKQREAAQLFSPRTPIAVTDMFSGRYEQILKLNATISQPGAHAIIYGERGVGKTSLANIAPFSFSVEMKAPLDTIVAPRIACDSTDTFDSLWRKVFKRIKVASESRPIGYLAKNEGAVHPLLDELHIDTFTPGEVGNVLDLIGKKCHLVVTLDEFDRLPKGEVPLLVADLIKSLSDNDAPATVVIVGRAQAA
jgi:Cdc6-like AAA superfamily ATPase